MKRLLTLLLIIVGFTFAAKPLVLEICNPSFCYELIARDAKKWEWKTDFTGKKFVRVYFYDTKKMLDIPADRLTVKARK